MQPVTSPIFEAEVLNEHVNAIAGDKPIAAFDLKALNNILGGVFPGQNYAICTRPSVGKTTLALQEADKLARDGHTVIFVSAELPQHKLLAKSLTRLSEGELTLSTVADAASPEHQKHNHFKHALEKYREEIAPNLCITGPLTVTDLGCLAGSCIRERGQVPILFIDYLQLLACGSAAEPFMDERLAIASCVKGLRDISNCYGCPIIALSSITRTAYSTKKPDLSMFGGSSAIEYGFDAALHLTEDDEKTEFPFDFPGDKEKRLKLVALKNRYGTLSTAKLEFDGASATFRDRN